MSKKKVTHIDLPTVSIFAGKRATVSTRKESFEGLSPVVEKIREAGKIAMWGPGNDHPQRVIKDIQGTTLIGNVIDRKVNMLLGGGVRYGTLSLDDATGYEVFRPIQVAEIEDWKEDSNLALYCEEALRDYYTYANAFPEFQMGRGRNYVTGIGAHDASQCRLSAMTDKGEIKSVYVADWAGGATDADADAVLTALDPYSNYGIVRQILSGGKDKYVLPLRALGDGQFYYALARWNALRTNGWLDVTKRVPEIKNILLERLRIINYHVELDERYWTIKYPDWEKKTTAQKMDLMRSETTNIDNWLQNKGYGGIWMSTMLGQNMPKGQESLVKINDKKGSILEGAYIEDSQEADFVIVRDLGLAPQLHGISPSKSKSSPGSGSADRVLRTNHILDSKVHADRILSPLYAVSRINGWNEKYGKGQRLCWWFGNYYAATLDRTMQVGDMNKPQINEGD